MVEKDEICKEKVSHIGLGDFKAAYSHAYSWIKDRGFTITEDKYEEKVEGTSKDINVEWTASKKITDYFKIVLKVRWLVIGLVDVEVEIDGKKKQMNKYKKLELEIKSILEKDYGNSWTNKPSHKFFKEAYHKYIVPQRIQDKETQCSKMVQDFKEEMKAFFELTARR